MMATCPLTIILKKACCQEKKFGSDGTVKLMKFEKKQRFLQSKVDLKPANILELIVKIDDLSSLKFLDNLYGLLTPTLLVEYWRDYFVLDGCRITVDSDIRYATLRIGPKYEAGKTECVLEVKSERPDFGPLLQSYLRNSTSRFSKYCKEVTFLRINNRV